jgi:predicted nuclease of predicted toxin-antitoxin system
VKLLFDQNISFRITKKLNDILPESIQVKDVQLENKKDLEIWIWAKENGYTIVTFDADFRDLSLIKGSPPKVIWIRTGNLTTSNIEKLIRKKLEDIQEFISNPEYQNIECLELIG